MNNQQRPERSGERADAILRNPEKYFSEARERAKREILAERKHRPLRRA